MPSSCIICAYVRVRAPCVCTYCRVRTLAICMNGLLCTRSCGMAIRARNIRIITSVCSLCMCIAVQLRVLTCAWVSVTAIPGIKYPIPSELGSQTTTGVVSTAVGDHAGIRRVVTFVFYSLKQGTLESALLFPHFIWCKYVKA